MQTNYPEDIPSLQGRLKWEIIPRQVDKECWQMWELLRKQYAANNPRPTTFLEIAEWEKTRAFIIEHEIMDGLSRLPESLRETMVLRHLSDLPYEKIAEQLSCKVGTVKSRLARGRELLREYLVSKEIPENQTKRSI